MSAALDTLETLSEEIRALLEARGDATAGLLARLEDTLTAGYARALALDADRLRVERQIAAIAAAPAPDREAHADQLADLAGKLQALNERALALRVLLDALNARGKQLRAA